MFVENIYTFVRKEGFYTVPCFNDEQAIECAKINKGTLEVLNMDKKVIWKAQDE